MRYISPSHFKIKNSDELLGKYDSLVDGRQDTDFQRDSCLNKDKDGRKEERERNKKQLGKKNPFKIKKPPTQSIWSEDDHV